MKLAFAGVALAGMFVSLATAQPAEQFDLVCTGQVAAEKVAGTYSDDRSK